MPEGEVTRDLFLHWLGHTYGRAVSVTSGDANAWMVADGELSLVVEVHPLLAGEDAEWESQRSLLEDLISDGLPACVALWAPAGARLPTDEPALSEFIDQVRQSAVRLGPHERSYAPFPITLYLRKTAETGGVVSVRGGLNPYWARFTDRVRGSYDLDSVQLHRLPEPDEHLEKLIDTVVEASEGLEVGQVTAIETIDAWTVQRLEGSEGVTIVGVPPSVTEDAGLAVRRNLRRILAEAGPRLKEADAGARALVLTAYYARIEQEGATTAMRGCDPVLYRGIDFVCVVTDGLVKPMIHPPAGAGWDPVAERMGIGGDQ